MKTQIIRPSALPALAESPCFCAGSGNKDTDQGTQRHKLFRDLLVVGEGDCKQVLARDYGLSKDETEAVKWAAEKVMAECIASPNKILTEYHLDPVDDDTFEPLFENGGTADAIWRNHVFDLKWRPRDYRLQMAAYAIGVFQQFEDYEAVFCHVLFGNTRQETVYEFTRESALALVVPVIDAAKSRGDGEFTPSDYCGWCANLVTCPVKCELASTIAQSREKLKAETRAKFLEWVVAGAHSSDIDDPHVCAVALEVARELAKWAEGVEHRAKEMSQQGRELPGFSMITRQGNRFIESVAGAYPRLGICQDAFLSACEIKFSKLVELYAEQNGGLKKSVAEKELAAKLGDLLKRKPSTLTLKKDNTECEN